ncbi:hypothetical protein Tco_1410886 [Tanacetum coccineum]
MVHYQLIRAYGSSKRHSSMISLLQGINREDLQTLWKLVKTKHGDLRPEDEPERVLWGDLKKFENVHIFMLVEKRYPLTPITITNMLNKKLRADHWNEMCYQLLKLMDDDLIFDTGVLDDDEVFVDVTIVEKEEQSTKTGEAVTTAGVKDSVLPPTIPTTIEETLAQH